MLDDALELDWLDVMEMQWMPGVVPCPAPSPPPLLLLLLPVLPSLGLVSLVADEDEAASFPPEDDRRVGAGLAPAVPPAPAAEAAGTAAPPEPVPEASVKVPSSPEEDDNRRRFLGLALAALLLVVPVSLPDAPPAESAPDVLEMVLPDAATAAAADRESPSLSLLPLSSLESVRA